VFLHPLAGTSFERKMSMDVHLVQVCSNAILIAIQQSSIHNVVELVPVQQLSTVTHEV